MIRVARKTCLFTLAAATLAVASQKIECFVVAPPEKILEGVKKIAILDFENREGKGRAMNDYLTAQLLLEDRGITNVGGGLFTAAQKGKTFQKGARTNVYDLVERSQLDKVLQEQNLSNSGMINEQQAAQIGKVLGLDAIVTGSVSISSNDENSQVLMRRMDGSQYYRYCTTRKVSVNARMKIVSVNTAQIIGIKDTGYVNSQMGCDELRSGLPSAADLADACLKQIAVDFANYFSPRFKLMRFEFSDIRNKQYKDKAREVNEYLKNFDFDNAFPIYKAVYDADPYNVDAIEALAELYDLVGNFPKAVEYAKIDAEIDAKKYQAYVTYLEKELEMQKILESLGVKMEMPDFTAKADALAKKITTRGDRDDRLDVKSQPDNGAETVAKIPGKMDFSVLEEKGDWVKIKLVGGKEGYLSKKDIK